jgi:hypothetical protein
MEIVNAYALVGSSVAQPRCVATTREGQARCESTRERRAQAARSGMEYDRVDALITERVRVGDATYHCQALTANRRGARARDTGAVALKLALAHTIVVGRCARQSSRYGGTTMHRCELSWWEVAMYMRVGRSQMDLARLDEDSTLVQDIVEPFKQLPGFSEHDGRSGLRHGAVHQRDHLRH